MTELLDSEQRQGLMIEQHVEAELANDPPNDLMWWRRLFRAIDKWAPPGQRLLLVTTEGRVIGAERSEMQIIRTSASADARSYATGPARTASC